MRVTAVEHDVTALGKVFTAQYSLLLYAKRTYLIEIATETKLIACGNETTCYITFIR